MKAFKWPSKGSLTIRARLIGTMAFFCVMLLGVAALGIWALRDANTALEHALTSNTEATRLAGWVRYFVLDSRTHVLAALQHNPAYATAKLHDHPISVHVDAIKTDSDNLKESIALLAKASRNSAVQDVIPEFEMAIEGMNDVAGEAVQALEAGRWDDAAKLLPAKIVPAAREVDGKVAILLDTLGMEGKAAQEAAKSRYLQVRLAVIVGVALGIALGVFVAWRMMRAILRPLNSAIGHFGRIAEGNLDNRIEPNTHDEMGQLLGALRDMQAKLKEDLERERAHAEAERRLKVALDSVSVGVIVADANRKVIYVNEAAHRTLKMAEGDLRAAMPSFSSDHLVGVMLDDLCGEDHEFRNRIESLKTTVHHRLAMGPRHFQIAAGPVRNDAGDSVGTVTEWRDVTSEVRVQEEVEGAVRAAQMGEFSTRIPLEGKSGYQRTLAEGLNRLLGMVSESLADLTHVLEGLASGDLGKRITNDYRGMLGDLKDATNTTIERLQETVERIHSASDSIRGSTGEISQGNSDLAARTESQAAALQETAASMEEITGTVKLNADNAARGAELAAMARQQADEGGMVMRQTATAMGDIRGSATRIANIISVIDEIAFQTNLLALNAAVEAARAGEQGRGFAVVAQEVRSLASRSAEAAKEIKGLIKESVTKVEEGAGLVQRSSDALTSIIDSAQQVNKVVSEIAASTREQALGIEQINQAVTQMDAMVQSNAALVDRVAQASRGMTDQAHSMSELVGFFKIGHGSHGASSSAGRSGGERRGESRPWSGGKAQGASHLDFPAARKKHLAWKARIRGFLDGKESLSAAQAVSHHDCDLGKWLYSGGIEKYSHLPAMKKLEKDHEDLHATIRRIIGLKEGGDVHTAEDQFPDVERLSNEIVTGLTRIEQESSQGSSKGGGSPAHEPTKESRRAPRAMNLGEEWEAF